MRNKTWLFVWGFALGVNLYFSVVYWQVINTIAAIICVIFLSLEWRKGHE